MRIHDYIVGKNMIKVEIFGNLLPKLIEVRFIPTFNLNT